MNFSFFSGIAEVIASAFSVYNAIETRSRSRQAARQVRAASDLRVARKQAELERLRGQQRVAYAKAGVKLPGTPTIVMDETQTEGQSDMDILRLNGARQASTYEARATQAALTAGVTLASRFRR